MGARANLNSFANGIWLPVFLQPTAGPGSIYSQKLYLFAYDSDRWKRILRGPAGIMITGRSTELSSSLQGQNSW